MYTCQVHMYVLYTAIGVDMQYQAVKQVTARILIHEVACMAVIMFIVCQLLLSSSTSMDHINDLHMHVTDTSYCM